MSIFSQFSIKTLFHYIYEVTRCTNLHLVRLMRCNIKKYRPWALRLLEIFWQTGETRMKSLHNWTSSLWKYVPQMILFYTLAWRSREYKNVYIFNAVPDFSFAEYYAFSVARVFDTQMLYKSTSRLGDNTNGHQRSLLKDGGKTHKGRLWVTGGR